MRAKKNLLIVVLFFLITFGNSAIKKLRAQENLLSEVSYLYLEKLIASAKENYPRLKTFSSQVSSARQDLSIAKTSWLDPFSFQFVSRSNKANTSNVVDVSTSDILNGYQFGISLNPGSLLAKPGQVKKARELVKVAESNLAEYNLQLETEVKKRYFTYLQYKASLATAASSYVDVETNFKAVKLKYQKSETTLEEYTAASIAYNGAVQARNQAESSFLISKADLEELTVKKLEEIK